MIAPSPTPLLTYNDRDVKINVEESTYKLIPHIHRTFTHGNSLNFKPKGYEYEGYTETFDDFPKGEFNDQLLVFSIIDHFIKKKELNSAAHKEWEIEGFQMYHAGKQRAVVITVSLSSGYARSFLMPRICIKIVDTPSTATARKKEL